jgi:hypothetical protein
MKLDLRTPVRLVISADGVISGRKTVDGEPIYDVTLESGRIVADILETDLIPAEQESNDYWNDKASDAEADADVLASAGHGTDEDYSPGDRY